MRASIEQIKQQHPPSLYYRLHLKGEFGQPTGKGWHRWNGLCPFHADPAPGTFAVNKLSGAFRCSACGNGGHDIISFHMQKFQLSSNGACDRLEEAIIYV